jgi:hypothetical protein
MNVLCDLTLFVSLRCDEDYLNFQLVHPISQYYYTSSKILVMYN